MEHLSDVDVKGDGKTKFAVSNWTSYTNQKASMENSGEEGHLPVDGVKAGTKKAIQLSGFPVSAYLRLAARGTVKAAVLSLAWMKPEEYWKIQRSGKHNLDFDTEESRKGIMMRRYCKLKGVKQKIDHHKFNELIGRVLLDPVNEWPK